MRRCLPALWLGLLLGQQPAPDYLGVRSKLDRIEQERMPRGAIVTFTLRELNAYVLEEVRSVAPDAVRNPRLELKAGGATARALVDFLKLRQAQGIETNWLLSKLISGEREVSVTARLESSRGRAKVDVDSVSISGVPIEGAALDFLIRKYVLAYYPDARVGEPFELRHRIERVDVRPGVVRVQIAR